MVLETVCTFDTLVLKLYVLVLTLYVLQDLFPSKAGQNSELSCKVQWFFCFFKSTWSAQKFKAVTTYEFSIYYRIILWFVHLSITLARPGTILPIIREITVITTFQNVQLYNQIGNVQGLLLHIAHNMRKSNVHNYTLLCRDSELKSHEQYKTW